MRKRDSIKTAEKANNDSSVNTQRVQWLDSIRGVSFLIVIYVHCTFFDSMALRNYLMPVMLTSFFFVSGYLHKDVSFAKFLEQHTRTLYIPSVILGLFLVFTSWLLPIVSSSTDIKHEILGVIFQYDGYHHGVWFVAALYIYSILFYLMVRFMGGGVKLLGFGIILYIGNWFYFIFNGPLLPWYLCQFGFSVYFMILGYLYRRHENQVDLIVYRSKFLIWVAFMTYIVAIYFANQSYSIMGSKYIVDCFLITNLNLYIYVYFNKQYLLNMWCLRFIGCNSLLYFGLHGKILTLTTFILSRFINTESISYPEIFQLITVIVVAVLTALPVIIINRYVPQITGKGYNLYKFKNK